VFGGGAHWRHLANADELSVCSGDAACCQIALTTCYYYVDAVCCYRLSRMVCRSVTLVSPAKAAEPIEMPFGLRTQVGPGNHVLDGVQIPHGKGQF